MISNNEARASYLKNPSPVSLTQVMTTHWVLTENVVYNSDYEQVTILSNTQKRKIIMMQEGSNSAVITQAADKQNNS